ncbi:MAG: hypothetical protein GXO26_05275 [Crenarchaeota archaeon]|nr:hypothetical protein [Thermoproteota archaeon]
MHQIGLLRIRRGRNSGIICVGDYNACMESMNMFSPSKIYRVYLYDIHELLTRSRIKRVFTVLITRLMIIIAGAVILGCILYYLIGSLSLVAGALAAFIGIRIFIASLSSSDSNFKLFDGFYLFIAYLCSKLGKFNTSNSVLATNYAHAIYKFMERNNNVGIYLYARSSEMINKVIDKLSKYLKVEALYGYGTTRLY